MSRHRRSVMRFERLWRNAQLATFSPDRRGMGIIEAGAIAMAQGQIGFVGPEGQLPSGLGADEEFDLEGRLVTPGLIDCHTHLVYGGERANEFEQRLAGASYEVIA